MISDSQIKSAIKSAKSGNRRIELRDPGDRGGGRLTLVVRDMKSHTACEWYAAYYRDGKRRLVKIGAYPTQSLSEARTQFREEFAPIIMTGVEPHNRFARSQHKNSPDISVRSLFTAYVDHLKRAGKPHWYKAERMLLKGRDSVVDAIGADRPAKLIDSDTIVSHLAAIHSRGAIATAHNVRACISAAYSFGMKSEHNYTRREVIGKWGIKANPVAAIPTDTSAIRALDRYLSVREFKVFWEWLEKNRERSEMALALQLMMATGQRVQEILRISDRSYDRAEHLIVWDKTKNGLPHSIPLPKIAIGILRSLSTNTFGLFFPNRFDPSQPALYTSPNKLCQLYFKETQAETFTPRDLRRTWKTLAGRAGVSKEMRDQLQNHARRSDVSSRHYDRYDYLAERRIAMGQWEAFMMRVLNGEIDI